MGVIPDIFRKRFDEQSVVTAPSSFDGEHWRFPKNGELVLPDCETQLPGKLHVNADQRTIRFVLDSGKQFAYAAEYLRAYLVPFHEIVEQYRQGLDVMAMMRTYDVSEQFLASEPLSYGAQTSLVVKEPFSGVDVFRANLGNRGYGVENVEVERYAQANVGNYVNVDGRLRRGKNMLHLVSADIGPVVHPWSNTVGLVGFIPPERLNEEGHKLPVSYMAFEPQVTLRREGHTVSISASSRYGGEYSHRVGVFYKGAWHPSEIVDLDIPEVDSLTKPLTSRDRDRARVVIQSIAGAESRPQDLAVLEFVQCEEQTYFLYDVGTDFGTLRSGILEYQTVAPHVSEHGEQVVYTKPNGGRAIADIVASLEQDARYFKLDKYKEATEVQANKGVTIV